MGAQHAFALESDLLGDPLGRDVVGIGDQIEALKVELLERVAREKPQRTSAHAPAADEAATQ